MNANILVKIQLLKKVTDSISDKSMANNRPFNIMRAQRVMREVEAELGIGLGMGDTWVREGFVLINEMRKKHSIVVEKGYKDAKAECQEVSKLVRIMMDWWENKLNAPEELRDLGGNGSIAEPGLPLLATDDSKSGIYSESGIDPSEVSPAPSHPVVETLDKKLEKARANINAFLGRDKA